jgi:hypothetical protein
MKISQTLGRYLDLEDKDYHQKNFLHKRSCKVPNQQCPNEDQPGASTLWPTPMYNPQSALYTTDQPLQIALIAYAPLEQMLKATCQDTLPVVHLQIDTNVQKEHDLQKPCQVDLQMALD